MFSTTISGIIYECFSNAGTELSHSKPKECYQGLELEGNSLFLSCLLMCIAKAKATKMKNAGIVLGKVCPVIKNHSIEPARWLSGERHFVANFDDLSSIPETQKMQKENQVLLRFPLAYTRNTYTWKRGGGGAYDELFISIHCCPLYKAVSLTKTENSPGLRAYM